MLVRCAIYAMFFRAGTVHVCLTFFPLARLRVDSYVFLHTFFACLSRRQVTFVVVRRVEYGIEKQIESYINTTCNFSLSSIARHFKACISKTKFIEI